MHITASDSPAGAAPSTFSQPGWPPAHSAVGLPDTAPTRALEFGRLPDEAQRAADHLQRLALVAQNTSNGVIITDAQRRITWVNAGFERITGFSADEALGQSPGRLLQCEGSNPDVVADIRASLQAEQHFKGEILNRGKQGRLYTVEMEIRPMRDDQGVLIGFMAIELDITERKAAMAQLEATAQAQKAFIATLSHELRTPLQSVIGYTELGRLRATEHPALDHLFAAAQAGGHRMLRLVNGLLEVAKIDGDVEALQLDRADIAALAAGVRDELLPLAAQRDVRIAMSPALPGLPADVDAFRIEQVIRNVLANALRFAPPGSVICIDGQDRGAQGIELSVRDQGPGIPKEELETVFDAFAQSSGTRQGSDGTGLGLTISRKLMRAHGGSIRAVLPSGGGALIILWLPQSMLSSACRPPASAIDVVHNVVS